MVLLANDTDTPNNCVKAVKVIPWPNRYIEGQSVNLGLRGLNVNFLFLFSVK